jgi:predicted ATPase/class 3 adenylate cyclase
MNQNRMDPAASLPTGTVTFLFTDIEGSTRLLHHLRDRYVPLLEEHHSLMRAAFEPRGGREVDTQGDAFFVAFARAADAVAAAVAAQRAFLAHSWPEGVTVRVRMGMLTGEPTLASTGYVGVDVHRAARIAATGYGGQILLSQTTCELVGLELPPETSLRDLGFHHLKDLLQPERIYQVVHPELPSDFPPLKSLDSLPNNLPQQLTSFIGREREMAEVQQLLKSTKLLTLTGAGGCGKTRLSLQVAANLLEEYPNGVWLVELAPLTDPALVPQTIMSALGVHEELGQSVLATLTDYLKSRKLLLVLDNCEHLLAACSNVAAALLRACPSLQILATSRECLGVPGETIWRVPSLSLPALPRRPSAGKNLAATLVQYEAVRLFIDRSTAMRPSFAVSDENALAVAQICRRLDGIPLALELAAARVKVLSVEQIAQRLDDRFRLLTGGSRVLLPRQQTLRALIDWSYDLLSEAERLLLRRVSVFAGGFSLEAAEAVCAGDGLEEYEVLDLLTQIVDKSLVLSEEQGQEVRYRLLETIRQYGEEHLRGSGDEAVLRGRHRDWYLQLAEQAEPELRGPEQAMWLDRLETEHDNLRAALTWSVERGEAEAGLRLGAALELFWSVRGYLVEGRKWLTELLALPEARAPTAPGVQALQGVGVLAYQQGEYDAARSYIEESLSIGRDLGEAVGIADSLCLLGDVALAQGSYPEARSLFEESLSLYRASGDQSGIAGSLNKLGRLAQNQGDDAAARSLFEESLAIQRLLGNQRMIAVLLNNLGWVSHNQGDLEAAHSFYEEALQIWRELADKADLAVTLINLALVAQERADEAQAIHRYEESLALFHELGDRYGIAACLKELGGLVLAQAQPERATRLYAAAHALREAMGVPLPPSDSLDYERCLAALREQLGEPAFAAVWAEGSAMSLEQAVAFAAETVTMGP